MQITVAGVSRRGARSNNQDAIGLFPDERVFAIADGMGGLEQGERISAAAIAAVRREVRTLCAEATALSETGSPERRTALFAHVNRMLHDASTELYKLTEEVGQRMGTTLTTVVIAGDRIVIGHIGDTRLYRIRKGQAKLLTEDHSVAAARVRRGIMTIEEYNKSAQRSVLYQSLGPVPEVEPDVIEASLQQGDTLVLCSDGVWAHVPDDELPRLATATDPRDAARDLADTAIARGSDDNCTAIVVRIDSTTTSAGAPLPRSLGSSILFRSFKEADLRLLAPFISYRDLAESEWVVREGEEGDEMYIIESGAIEVSRGGFPLSQLGPGAHFGELAVATHAAHTASFQATLPTRVLVLHRRYLDNLSSRRPDLAVQVLHTLLSDLAGRLSEFTERLGRAERSLWARH